jgi:SAM-dependent methyltransferase
MDVDESDVAAAWDENAARWIDGVRSGFDRFRDVANNPAFLNFLPEIVGRDVIDLGCGEGYNTRVFASLGARMTGIDLSERLINAAIAAESDNPLGIHYRVASYADLSTFADKTFDVALSTMALMDGPDFSSVARSVARVLRPDGWFCFSVTHPCFVTPVSRWVEDEGGAVEGKLVADYWRETPFTERWGFRSGSSETEPFTIWYFPYRLEDYINGLCAAGFRIARIAEPRPTEEMSPITRPWHPIVATRHMFSTSRQ